MTVDTKTVKGRRRLSFSSHDQVIEHVRKLATQPTHQLGNWTLGQICTHLAKAMDSAIDGSSFRPSWLVRTVAPWIKNRVIAKGMSPGFQLPPNAASLLPPSTDNDAGIAALEKSIARFQSDPTRKPHGAFGPMTNQEWNDLLLRHAELHLSFIVPD
jgi:hypothetical protein